LPTTQLTMVWRQCCQIFLDTIYQNGRKFTKLPLNYHMAIKCPYQTAIICSKWPTNMPTFSIPRPSEMNPNWSFWFENIPSGNPGYQHCVSLSTCILRDAKRLTTLWIENFTENKIPRSSFLRFMYYRIHIFPKLTKPT
jgi:hypothetical protein